MLVDWYWSGLEGNRFTQTSACYFAQLPRLFCGEVLGRCSLIQIRTGYVLQTKLATEPFLNSSFFIAKYYASSPNPPNPHSSPPPPTPTPTHTKKYFYDPFRAVFSQKGRKYRWIYLCYMLQRPMLACFGETGLQNIDFKRQIIKAKHPSLDKCIKTYICQMGLGPTYISLINFETDVNPSLDTNKSGFTYYFESCRRSVPLFWTRFRTLTNK